MKKLKNKKEEKLQKGVLFCNFSFYLTSKILSILYNETYRFSIFKYELSTKTRNNPHGIIHSKKYTF